MNYEGVYSKLLALAAKPARDTRGKKYFSYYWIRLDKHNPSRFAIGYYRSRGGGWTIRIPRNEQVFFPCIEFDKGGFTIVKFEKRTIPAPPGYTAKYGDGPWEVGRDNYVDIGTNNLLASLFGSRTLQHHGNGVTSKPGFLWCLYGQDPINIVGAVRYDAKTDTIAPTKAQPEKHVDTALRTRIAKLLRATYRRQRVLSRIGVEITPEAIQEFVGPDEGSRQYVTFSKTDAYRNWADPHKLLDAMERYDSHDKYTTTEIVARMHAVQQHWAYSVYQLVGVKPNYKPATLLDDPKKLERLRRRMYKLLKIVDYK